MSHALHTEQLLVMAYGWMLHISKGYLMPIITDWGPPITCLLLGPIMDPLMKLLAIELHRVTELLILQERSGSLYHAAITTRQISHEITMIIP